MKESLRAYNCRNLLGPEMQEQVGALVMQPGFREDKLQLSYRTYVDKHMWTRTRDTNDVMDKQLVNQMDEWKQELD
jgi:hypothetical protein